MRMIAAIGVVVFSAAVAVEAQYSVRTVTNEDLAKYRDQRLAAEKEYRENYEKLGMPSPEKLEEMRERDMESRLVLADQLRQARLESERIETDRSRVMIDAERLAMERMVAESQMASQRYESPVYYSGGYSSYGYGGYGGYGQYGGYGYPGYNRPRFGIGIGIGGGLPGYVPLWGYPNDRLYPTATIPNPIYTPYGTVRGAQVIRPLPITRRPRR